MLGVIQYLWDHKKNPWGRGGKEGGDEIHMRKELILGGGGILYFQRGEGGSEGNLTESDIRNPIWNWEGYPDQSKNPIITKVGKGVISFEKKKNFWYLYYLSMLVIDG